jgi:glutamate/tyrosine decarboxylase-like PLP-dependent enzyme
MARKQDRDAASDELTPTYAARELSQGLPKKRMNETGVRPRIAYQVIHDELRLDGFSLLNLATFVTTWMDEEYAKHARFTLFDLADKLRERGWLVPAYPMPRNREDLVVQRVVVKEDFSRELAERLLEDLRNAVVYFESQPGHRPKAEGSHFHH